MNARRTYRICPFCHAKLRAHELADAQPWDCGDGVEPLLVGRCPRCGDGLAVPLRLLVRHGVDELALCRGIELAAGGLIARPAEEREEVQP